MESQEMIVSKFNGVADVRGMQKDGQAWFVAKDICDALDIQNSRQAVAELDVDEKLVYAIHTSGQARSVNLVNEFGAISLILRSRKPEAKAFKRWLTHEVIPCIMKTGAYITKQAAEELKANPLRKLKEVLDYALEMEDLSKRQSEVIDLQSKAIEVTSKALDQAKLELADAEPYIAFARSFMDTDGLILATYIAAECHENTAVFNKWLHKMGFIKKLRPGGPWVPRTFVLKQLDPIWGAFDKPVLIKHNDGREEYIRHWKWTPRGAAEILMRWNKTHPEQQVILDAKRRGKSTLCEFPDLRMKQEELF